MLKLLLFTSFLIINSLAFSSPGTTIKAYGGAEVIPVYGDQLSSPKTQQNHEYFYLNFCKEGRDNLDTPRWFPSDTFQFTPYGVWARVSRGCVHLCRRDFSKEDVQKFIDLIDGGYRMNLVLDNLPVRTNETSDIGVLLGFKENGKYYIHNHLSFRIELNNVTKDTDPNHLYRVVSFTAAPKSLQTMMIQGRSMGFCENDKTRPLNPEYQEIKAGPIFFSFDLKFFDTPTTLAERTEAYKQLGSDAIHSLSLIVTCAANLGLILFIRSLFNKPVQNSAKLNPVSTDVKSLPFYIQALSLWPFASIFIELKYLMISVWQHKFYYLYSYLFAALFVLVIASASVSIIITYLYLNLNNGNQKTPFWIAGSTGLYVFTYAVFFSFSELDLIGLSAHLTYFGYMIALSFLVTVFCGFIGSFASSWFTGLIYSSPQALESKQK